MPPAPLKITVLGSGTSMGVPTLSCHCRVCTSTDSNDKRLRPSILLSRHAQNAVIDTTPDFRQQALRARMERLDAILLTHAHADHVMGFDDIRPYNIRQQRAIPVHSNEETFGVLRRAFAYIFDGKPKVSSVPSVELINVSTTFELLGLTITPIPLLHGDLPVLGFRFGAAAYLTDFSSIPEPSLALLHGLDILILDALRDVPHPMHQTVEQALALIKQLQPRQAWFTHIAHDLPHAETNRRLRNLGFPNVQLAYDGLELVLPISTADESQSAAKPVAQQKISPAPLQVFPSTQEWSARYAASGCGSALAIGNFDGSHLGHQAILRAASVRARESGAVSAVLTFDPTPQKILRPESAPLRITTTPQRLACFAALGLNAAIVLPFSLELAKLSPQEFVDQILVRDLQVRAVFVGENFRFGHKQSGDAQLLRQLGASRGFEVCILPPVRYKNEIVSSTIIRREIAAGQVSRAARLLGRAFVLTGKIVEGTGTGRRVTVPTLNLVPEQELLPARGVYITRTLFAGHSQDLASVTNIGFRPTFNGSSLTVETHLLDPMPEIAELPNGSSLSNATGQSGSVEVSNLLRIELRFCRRLRDEKKFSSPEELRAQIALDVARAQRFFRRVQLLRTKSQPL